MFVKLELTYLRLWSFFSLSGSSQTRQKARRAKGVFSIRIKGYVPGGPSLLSRLKADHGRFGVFAF